MYQNEKSAPPRTIRRRAHRGLTLVELLMAMSVMMIVGGAVAALASAAHMGNEYNGGVAKATQHGRVVVERIARSVRGATAAEDHPGCVVLDETVGDHRFAETLVVWHPVGEPANLNGPPLVSELVIFSPNPEDPTQLLEITAPSDARELPFSVLSTEAGRKQIERIKVDPTSKRVLLTDMLRVGRVSTASLLGGAGLRAAVNFARRLRPSEAQWNDHRAGRLAWNDLAWPQGIRSNGVGLRQVWLHFEIQLAPHATAAGAASTGEIVPFFGSAAIFYPMKP